MKTHNKIIKLFFFICVLFFIDIQSVDACSKSFRSNREFDRRRVWAHYLEQKEENQSSPSQGASTQQSGAKKQNGSSGNGSIRRGLSKGASAQQSGAKKQNGSSGNGSIRRGLSKGASAQQSGAKKQNSSSGNGSIRSLGRRIGYSFKRRRGQKRTLRKQVMLQLSKVYQQRLEFLGDAVFNLTVYNVLVDKYPDATKKQINAVWVRLVSNVIMSDLALFFQLDQQYNTQSKRRLADLLEVVVGAVYLDGGYGEAKRVVRRLIDEDIRRNFVSRGYQDLLSSDFSSDSNSKFKSLGQHILNLHIIDVLMQKYPKAKPSLLGKKKALIKPWIMQTIVRDFDLELTLSNMYLDRNYLDAKKLVIFLFRDVVRIEPLRTVVNIEKNYVNYVNILDEFIYNNFQRDLVYKGEKVNGRLREMFSIEISFDESVLGIGRGFSRREAAQNAAYAALKDLWSISFFQPQE